MSKKIVVCWLVILLFSTFVQAHGNAIHVIGTITAVSMDTVTIKNKDGKSIVVMLGKATKYVQKDITITKSDLKVGSRVVIDVKMDEKMKMYVAQEVEIGTVVVPAKKR